MTLILIRAENQTKILNSLADIERHAGLKINGIPRIMDNTMADKYAQSILNAKLKSRSKIAVVVSVQEDATRSILQIKKIHPPAHILVISKEYTQWEKIKKIFNTLPPLKGYYSAKNPNLKKPQKK
jgi:uncharacterized protein